MHGKLLPEGRICWLEAPLEVVIQKPYAIALLPRFVEIRSLRAPYPLIQTVVLQNVHHLCQSNDSVILALDNCVHGLFPIPLGAQGRGSVPVSSGAREMASILDTALLQAVQHLLYSTHGCIAWFRSILGAMLGSSHQVPQFSSKGINYLFRKC